MEPCEVSFNQARDQVLVGKIVGQLFGAAFLP